ncbi:MAG: carbamate kinase, partial [Gemmatimonadetes bacterium]|nr:carbamate kinase [Gemmatimonadota bacterium]NIR99451.1 carbamate kinase [Gemmatimonadota bacterium]NIT67849.1 carbamate kinase [Gemmatimonadota bacterium]NIU51473.1 carbamate kinase [Gemmatimonadota bacterium]NIV24535.1 carbamate kinase [Gemmatimonadota bacterium]
PLPRAIVELEVIRALAASGTVVIACGGGGLPVFRDAEGDLHGVEAVIDKDFASGLLAREMGAELFLILTAVE